MSCSQLRLNYRDGKEAVGRVYIQARKKKAASINYHTPNFLRSSLRSERVVDVGASEALRDDDNNDQVENHRTEDNAERSNTVLMRED